MLIKFYVEKHLEDCGTSLDSARMNVLAFGMGGVDCKAKLS